MPGKAVSRFRFGLAQNQERVPEILAEKKRIYLATGSSRGGTSLLGYALRCSDAHFGEVDPNNHEIPTLMTTELTQVLIKRELDARLAEANVVGVKLPAFAFHLDWITKIYASTILLCILRNPLDLAESIMVYSPTHELSSGALSFGIKHGFRFYEAIAKAAPTIEQPMFFLSMEKIKKEPKAFVDWMQSIGVNFDEETKARLPAELGARGYKRVKP